MSAPDWIHCNKCFARYTKDLKFYLTGCGHLNCQKCVVIFENNGKKCIVCNTSTRAVPLSNDLGRDMLVYFQPAEDSVTHLKKVVNFQTKNMSALLVNVSHKYNQAKNEVMKCYKVINELKKDNIRLKYMLKNHSMNSGGSSRMSFNNTSTPMSNVLHPSPQSACNSTIISSVNSPLPSFGGRKLSQPHGRLLTNQYLYPSSINKSTDINQSNRVAAVHNRGTPTMGSMSSMSKLTLGNAYGRM